MNGQDIPLEELSGVLDPLTPDDLQVHFSGTEVFYVPAPAGSLRGRTAFDAFLRVQLRTVRTTCLATEGVWHPTAVLATPDTERVFAPVTAETGLEFLGRLRAAAHAVGARWLFLAHQPDPADRSVRYFAERREDDEVDTRFGVLRGSGTSHPRDLDDHLVGHLVARHAASAVVEPGHHLRSDLPAVAATG